MVSRWLIAFQKRYFRRVQRGGGARELSDEGRGKERLCVVVVGDELVDVSMIMILKTKDAMRSGEGEGKG